MLFILGSILFSAWLNIVFKLCERFGIDTFQTIVVNYGVCVLTGWMMLPPETLSLPANTNVWAIVLGAGFILTFNLTALTVKQNGVATATVATKVSLVIPVLFSLWLYNDRLDIWKIIAILLTLVSVVLTFMNKRSDADAQKKTMLLPLSIFIGCGLLDSLIKYLEHFHLSSQTADAFLVRCFLTAFSIGILLAIIGWIKGSIRFSYKVILAGIVLGVPNYFSIWCLIQGLKLYPDNSSVIIPVNNLGIVLINVLLGLLIFKEPLSKTNKLGIGLALLAILLLSILI